MPRLLASSIYDAFGGSGIGDRGSCAKLCNCNADCTALNPDLVCSSLVEDAPNLVQATRQRGYCSLPIAADGGVDPGIPSCNTGGAGGSAGTGGRGGTAGTGTGGTGDGG
jgi:hypothetical protein